MTLFKKNQNKNKLKTVKGSSSHVFGRDPYLDWAMIVAIFLIVSFFGIYIGVRMYVGIDESVSNTAPLTNSLVSSRVNIKKLQSTLRGIGERSSERATILRSYTAPKDPSL